MQRRNATIAYEILYDAEIRIGGKEKNYKFPFQGPQIALCLSDLNIIAKGEEMTGKEIITPRIVEIGWDESFPNLLLAKTIQKDKNYVLLLKG